MNNLAAVDVEKKYIKGILMCGEESGLVFK